MRKCYKPKLTIALCGNPNSGKTTLFNRLTGSNQKVGNWPGVTVEQKTGTYLKNPDVTIVDTPGVYSLTPYSADEQITGEYLLNSKPDLIINVVDATNLERSLLLTSELLELDYPIVVALNMQDEAAAKGIVIDVNKLKGYFGCNFVAVSAAKNTGIDNLMTFCLTNQLDTLKKIFAFSPEIEKTLKSIERSSNFTANKRRRTIMRNKLQSAKIIEERYEQISAIALKSQYAERTLKQSKRANLTDKIDKIVLNKWLAFPIFFVVMTIIFYMSIDGAGGLLTTLINERLTPFIQSSIANGLSSVNAPWLTSLICDGIVQGVMSVIGFTPQIMILFGFISALEASGYMSRIAFITDRLLNKLGLGGRSFVSMILGCGCSVPAIMTCRTIKSENERNATITLSPFMPCSAKLAIISFFAAKFFDGKAAFAICFYLVSIAAVIIGGYILKLLNKKTCVCEDAFVMELPEYRIPQTTNILKQIWERCRGFLLKAGTIILVASVILWFLQNFNFHFEFAETEDSILARIGKFIAPVFTPLGFNDRGFGWQFSVATLTGIFAKETVITTLEILLSSNVHDCISQLGAFCFVTYNLLTIPCIAAISASFAEQGKFKNGVKTMLFQISVAYVLTLLIYQTGILFYNHARLAAILFITAAIAIITVLCVVRLLNHRGCHGYCKTCNKSCRTNNKR